MFSNRSYSEPASHVARSKIILAVAGGKTYAQAAQAAGRKSRQAVSELISRFNQEGIAAIEPRHGGGPASTYGTAKRERILAEMRRSPDPEQDGVGKRTAVGVTQASSNENAREKRSK